MLVSIHKRMGTILILLSIFWGFAKGQEYSLEDCIGMALEENKGLKSQENQQQAAEIRLKMARANKIPVVTVNGEYKYFPDLPYQLLPLSAFGGLEGQFREVQFGVPNNINGNIRLTVPIFDPRIENGIRAGEVGEELSRLNYELRKEEVVLEISNLYYNAQVLQSQIAFVDSNLANSNLLLKNVRLLQAQKLAGKSEENQILLQKSLLEGQKIQLESKYKQLLNLLRFMVALPEETPFAISKEITPVVTPSPTDSQSVTLNLAQTRYKLKKEELNAARREYLPSVGLYGFYGTTGFGKYTGEDPFLSFYPLSSIGINLSYPLFNGTKTRKKVSLKRVELQTAELEMENLRSRENTLIRNSQIEMETAESMMGNLSKQLLIAQENYRLELLRYQNMEGSFAEIIQADNAVRKVQQDFLASKVDYLRASLTLKQLKGNFRF